nr:hypothetical protein [Flexivirga sp.]
MFVVEDSAHLRCGDRDGGAASRGDGCDSRGADFLRVWSVERGFGDGEVHEFARSGHDRSDHPIGRFRGVSGRGQLCVELGCLRS